MLIFLLISVTFRGLKDEEILIEIYLILTRDPHEYLYQDTHGEDNHVLCNEETLGNEGLPLHAHEEGPLEDSLEEEAPT